MLAKGLIAALILTSTPQVEAIHDLNVGLESQTHVWELDLAHPEILEA